MVSRIWVVALGGSGAGRVVHRWLRRGAERRGAPRQPRRRCRRVPPTGSVLPVGAFRSARLASSIDTQLKGNAVGYVALIGTSKAVSSGLARTAADPPKLAMGPDVMVNVASVGKIFTTIVVLKSLARHHLSIDSPISPFLPPNWVAIGGSALYFVGS